MTKAELKALELPDTPGVYFFLDSQKKIMYIGKATSLRSRVRSYFATDIKEKRSELISNMVLEAATVEVTSTESVLEALILETNLIRSHKPRYNTRSKDDKSYNHLVITNEEWPRVLVVRGKDLTEKFTEREIKYHFGPFPSGGLLREALKIVRKLFQYYDTKEPVGSEKTKLARSRVDFNRQIGLFPNHTDKASYDRTIRHLRLFFEGKKREIIKELTKEMMSLAKTEQFEEAGRIKRQLFALEHIQDIALIKAERATPRTGQTLRIEAYDIAHMDGKDMVGVMTVVEGSEPQKDEYRKFKIKTLKDANDPAALKEVLERRLAHPEWPFPNIIVVDGNDVQKRTAELLLAEHALLVPVVAVVKDDRHKAHHLLGPTALIEAHKLEILHANAESHRFAINYFRQKQRKRTLS
ncbi:MAG: GIY-YIG nuclease family protein [Candidatus Pacebacteria bacterium]|jgi:excinuclease ABC subunit C|nr:GIY-YIG nuclease family protein [Candidatus Paceibacterota bacterium]